MSAPVRDLPPADVADTVMNCDPLAPPDLTWTDVKSFRIRDHELSKPGWNQAYVTLVAKAGKRGMSPADLRFVREDKKTDQG